MSDSLEDAIDVVIRRAPELSRAGVMHLVIEANGVKADMTLVDMQQMQPVADQDDSRLEQIQARFSRPIP